MSVKRAAIKQDKQVKPLCHGEKLLKYEYGKAWHTDNIMLLQTYQVLRANSGALDGWRCILCLTPLPKHHFGP